MLKILCLFYNIVNWKICDINGFSNGGIIIGLWEDMIKIIKTNNNRKKCYLLVLFAVISYIYNLFLPTICSVCGHILHCNDYNYIFLWEKAFTEDAGGIGEIKVMSS